MKEAVCFRVERSARAAAGVLLAAAAVTCTNANGTTDGPEDVHRIVINPAQLELRPGESRGLIATAYTESGSVLNGTVLAWRSGNEAVATVSAGGQVTGQTVGSASITATTGSVEGQAQVVVVPNPPTGPVVDVLPSVQLQTMKGWEAVAQIGQAECNKAAVPIYRGALLDAAVNDLGINRVRLQIRSGMENPVDWFTQFLAGQITHSEFKTHWYEAVNDNGDPFSRNAAGFQWSELDHTVDEVVTPLRQRLQARGERLYVNLTYVDFGASQFEHSTNPEEYAEYLLAVFQHLQATYGWVPDAIEMILEPDNTGNWRANTIGAALVATGDRLAAAGFNPHFIAPSNTNMTRALEYFDELALVPRVKEYLTDFAYHRYGGVTDATLQAIGNRSVTHGIRTGMLEHIASGYQDLHDDIVTGRASSWEQFALAYCTNDNGAQYYTIDLSNPASPVVTLGSRGRYLRQYFRNVRLDAVRLGATSGDSRFSPLAFRNTDGRHVVILKASSGGTAEVRGLPAGTYGRYYTTAAATDVQLPDVIIASGESVTATIPAAGVITVHAR